MSLFNKILKKIYFFLKKSSVYKKWHEYCIWKEKGVRYGYK